MAVCLDHQMIYLKPRVQKASLRFQIIAAICLIVALILKVWIKLAIIDLGYQVAKERERYVSLDMERRELELQRSVLMRPDTLATAAHQRLGLTTLNSQNIRKIIE